MRCPLCAAVWFNLEWDMAVHERSESTTRARQRVEDAVVVGAGAVALATALALKQAGLAVTLVVDREPPAFDPDAEVDLRVYALAPDVLEGLDQLGLGPALRASRTASYQRMQVLDAASAAQLSFDAADYGWKELGLIVEHRLLIGLLWDALQRAEIPVRTHPQLLQWQMAEDHWRLPDLGLRTRLLLAADGGDSALRQAAGIEVMQRPYGQSALVAHVRWPQFPQGLAWQRFLAEGPLALLPLADGRSSIVWSMPTALAQRRMELPEAAFLAELGDATEHAFGAAEAVTARRAVPLRWMLAERYVSERLVLLGDAAHIVHPMAGQGLNLGLRDGLCLTRELRQCQLARQTDRSLHGALRAYARERRSENTLATTGIDLIGRLFRMQGPMTPLRGLGMRLLHKSGPIKHLLAQLAAGRLGRPVGP
jgi:2-octaprenyl-3-methyl-6-methoxy-1,4-benzoquinol hydroxylase/2-octaprenylphenol hydroxylase